MPDKNEDALRKRPVPTNTQDIGEILRLFLNRRMTEKWSDLEMFAAMAALGQQLIDMDAPIGKKKRGGN